MEKVKKWIIVMPCGAEQIPIITAFVKKGFNVLGVDQNSGAVAFPFCSDQLAIPLSDVEGILEYIYLKEYKVVQVVAHISDKAVVPALFLKSALGIGDTYNPFPRFHKWSFRRMCEKHDIPFPKFAEIVPEQVKVLYSTFGNSCVVKPSDSSGSRGVTVLENPSWEQWLSALKYAKKFSNLVIVEEYIPGDEYACELFHKDGNLVYSVSCKRYMLSKSTSDYIATVSEQKEILEIAWPVFQKVFQTLNYSGGPAHIEFKLWKGTVYIIDCAIRGGGAGMFNQIAPLATKADTSQIFVQHLLGERLSVHEKSFQHCGVFYLALQKEGVLRQLPDLGSTEGLVHLQWYREQGAELALGSADENRLGHIVVQGDTPELVYERAKTIKSIIFDKIQID